MVRLDRATAEQIAALPPVVYSPDKLSEKVGEDSQGNPFIAVMFKRRPPEIFLVVDDGFPPDAGEVDRLIAKMVIEETDE